MSSARPEQYEGEGPRDNSNTSPQGIGVNSEGDLYGSGNASAVVELPEGPVYETREVGGYPAKTISGLAVDLGVW